MKWASSHNSFSSLAAKESRTAVFNTEVQKDAPAKDYPVSLEVTYLDENLNLQSKTFNFTFHVSKKADFEITNPGSQGLYANENGKIIRAIIKNTGTDTAHKVKVKVLPQFPFSTDGSVRYIDSLEPGKTEEVQFSIDVDKDGTPGTYGLEVLLDYEDLQGKSFEDTATMPIEVKQKGIFRLMFEYWYIIGIAVPAGIIIFKRKNKKK